jgi:ribokinase
MTVAFFVVRERYLEAVTCLGQVMRLRGIKKPMTVPLPATSEPDSPDILVIGSANADLVVLVDRRPAAGEKVLGGDLAVRPGGKGANQAVAAARLGARVAFAGCLGSDAHGQLLLASLTRAGVDVSETCHLDGVPTGVALISVTPDGDNAIIVSPGANAHVSKGDVRRALTGGGRWTARVVVVQLELPLPVVEHAASIAATAGSRVVLNLAPPAALPRDLLELCDPLVLNGHEAQALLVATTGSANARNTPTGTRTGATSWPTGATMRARDTSEAVLELGPRSVVLTLGAAGAMVTWPGGSKHVAALPVVPVDTTGAGDALTGALAWRLAEGDGLVEAARFAVRVASTSTLLPGAQPSFPRLGDVLDPSPG